MPHEKGQTGPVGSMAGSASDEANPNGSVYARLKWWKDRADDDADEIQRLRDGIACAVNALTDSILCSGNDAATNMHFVRKLKALSVLPNP